MYNFFDNKNTKILSFLIKYHIIKKIRFVRSEASYRSINASVNFAFYVIISSILKDIIYIYIYENTKKERKKVRKKENEK